MATNLAKLSDTPLPLIRAATEALTNGGSLRVWEQAMRRILTTAHTAATIAAVGERSFGGRVRQMFTRLVGVRALPAEDRAHLKQAIDGQLRYLDGFIADLRAGTLTPAQATARAALYAGSIRGTFYAVRWGGWALPFAPCDGGTACKSNCKCSAHVVGDGPEGQYHYQMGVAEHCPDCAARAAGSPYTVRRRAA